MDTARTIVKSAKSFFAGTALSRVSGFLRDIAMATSFGSSPAIAAFFVAYRLANLFRRLFGEGNLNAAFVPHFSELKEKGGYFYRDVAFSMAVILFVAVIGIEATLWTLSQFVRTDWTEIIGLTMWMVPGLFFICLYGLNASVLQCHRKYFLPAVAPVAFNFIWMTSAYFIRDVQFLALTITLAFAGQWLVTLFKGLQLLEWREWLKPKMFSPDFQRIIKPLMLGIFGISAVQFNSALDPIFARFADLKGPVYLWYAIRIEQLPLALFGIALTNALLPPFSRAKDPLIRKELLNHVLQVGMMIMAICTFGVLSLSEVGVNLLFGHGDFGFEDVKETSLCLWGYGIGLLPSVYVLILASNCYSQKKYRLPTIASLVSVGVNLSLNVLFIFMLEFGTVSIAIATSLSALANCLVLARGVFESSLIVQMIRTVLTCFAVAIGVMCVQHFWMGAMSSIFSEQLLQFCSLALLYTVGVVVLLWKQGIKALLR